MEAKGQESVSLHHPVTGGSGPWGEGTALGGNGAPLDVGGTLVLPLDWKRVCRGTSCVAARVLRTLWKFQRLGVISLETPMRKWASSRLEGRISWIFSSWGRCSRLTTGTSGTRSGGLRNGQTPCEYARGPLGIPLPSMPVPKTLCGVGA